jgi:excisionase family DNA binding protein
MKKEVNKKFYKVAEAAQLLRFSPLTLYRWIKKGRIKAVKMGFRSYRISARELSVLLDQ